MVWAALVAGGVAIVSMAIFGARLTRKDRELQDEIVPAADPNDPWAAWRPRPFEDLDRPARPRLWPVLTSLTGLVLVGGGLAGARQTFEPPQTVAAPSTPKPYLIEVKVTPSPTPVATPAPTPVPTRKPVATAKPQAAAASSAAAAPSNGPLLSGSASCSANKARTSFVATARDAALSYVGIYIDGKIVGGGPINSSSKYEATIERSTTPGDHDLEVSVQDKAGKSTRKQWRIHCA